MKYIVDTSVWSQALRRKSRRETDKVLKLRILINEGERILLPGIVLQEILQGVHSAEQFKRIYEMLSFFPMIEAEKDDYLYAAELFRICRSKGVESGTIDVLIAALAIRNECQLLTSDKDFVHIAKCCELRLI